MNMPATLHENEPEIAGTTAPAIQPLNADHEITQEPEHASIPLAISRDTAVQIVGSDAGRQRRIKTQSHMTKGATPNEIAAVVTLFEGFLKDEIKRVHDVSKHRPMTYHCQATLEQARALKGFCLRYAAHLRNHLGIKGHAHHFDRSQHRLDQTNDVIAQINAALNTPLDDGVTVDYCAEQLRAEIDRLRIILKNFARRVSATHPQNEPLNAECEKLMQLKTFLGA